MSRGTIDDFCTQVCRCVRFWPDHKAITAELTAHLEDHAAALEARGLSPEEAAAQAVTAMGEPEELGRQLDRAHPPLLCLSVAATNIILVFLLVVCILALALWSLDSAKTVLARRAAPEDTRAHYQERYEYPLAIDEWAEVDGLWLHFHTIGVMSSAGQPFAYEIYLTCDPADGWLPAWRCTLWKTCRAMCSTALSPILAGSASPPPPFTPESTVGSSCPSFPPKMRSTCGSRGTCSATPSG